MLVALIIVGAGLLLLTQTHTPVPSGLQTGGPFATPTAQTSAATAGAIAAGRGNAAAQQISAGAGNQAAQDISATAGLVTAASGIFQQVEMNSVGPPSPNDSTRVQPAPGNTDFNPTYDPSAQIDIGGGSDGQGILSDSNQALPA